MLGEQGLARQKGLEVGVQERTPKNTTSLHERLMAAILLLLF